VAEDFTDEEQAERIKQWWRDNGVSVVVSVVLAVAAVLGWQQWQGWQQSRSAQASLAYERMTRAMAGLGSNGEASMKQARTAANTLLEEHDGTIYADFAALTLARLAVHEDDYAGAASQLEKVVDNPAEAPLGAIARIRLARIELERGNHEHVAELIEGKLPRPWQGRAQELRGDLRLARGDRDGAREAYSAALDNLEAGDSTRTRVEMKLNDLATASS
jgi:predicted negative regulator of RcsB-dependent stress response